MPLSHVQPTNLTEHLIREVESKKGKKREFLSFATHGVKHNSQGNDFVEYKELQNTSLFA